MAGLGRYVFGRWNRATYLVWLTVQLVIALAAIGFTFVSFPWGAFVAPLVILFSGVVTAIPRLHDVGRSGWWAARAVALWCALQVFTMLSAGLSLPTIVTFSVIPAALIALLALWPGDPRPNRFGEPPRPGFAKPLARRPPQDNKIVDIVS